MVYISKSKYCKGNGLFTVKAVKKDFPLTAYPGLIWELGDKNLPKDTSYQVLIPGTKFVIDAGTMVDDPLLSVDVI